MAEQEFKRGWGLADIPQTPIGACACSRQTPLLTYNCILVKNMRAWKLMWFEEEDPNLRYKTHTKCRYAADMTKCPDFIKAGEPVPPEAIGMPTTRVQ